MTEETITRQPAIYLWVTFVDHCYQPAAEESTGRAADVPSMQSPTTAYMTPTLPGV